MVVMPAVEPVDDTPSGDAPHPLPAEVSPKVIAGHLFPEDEERFRAEYEAALDGARRTPEVGVAYPDRQSNTGARCQHSRL